MYLSRGKERHYGVTIHHSETLSNGHIVCSVLYAICMRCSFLAQCKRQNHKSWRTKTTMLKMRKTITMWESMCKKRRCTQKSSGNKKIKEQLEIFEIFELRSIFLRFSFTTSVFFFLAYCCSYGRWSGRNQILNAIIWTRACIDWPSECC